MKPYDVWLKGGANFHGEMTDEDADNIRELMKYRQSVVYEFQDGDGSVVCVDVADIAAFSYGCDQDEKEPIGFQKIGGRIS